MLRCPECKASSDFMRVVKDESETKLQCMVCTHIADLEQFDMATQLAQAADFSNMLEYIYTFVLVKHKRGQTLDISSDQIASESRVPLQAVKKHLSDVASYLYLQGWNTYILDGKLHVHR